MNDDPAAALLLATLESSELAVEPVGEHRWTTMLAGDWKRTIPVLLDLDERGLTVTSLFAGAPDEGHEDVYRLLLRRNQRPRPVHFALDDEGDLILVGHLPRAALDETRIDEMLGAVLELADSTFNSVLRAGFAGYLQAEQRWRAKTGMPPNPAGHEG